MNRRQASRPEQGKLYRWSDHPTLLYRVEWVAHAADYRILHEEEDRRVVLLTKVQDGSMHAVSMVTWLELACPGGCAGACPSDGRCLRPRFEEVSRATV